MNDFDLKSQPTITKAQYITTNQDILTITLSEPVTISNAAGWSAIVGGVAHNYNSSLLVRPNIQYIGGSGTNVLLFRLLFASPKIQIIPEDVAIGVTVSYDGLGNTGPGMPASGPILAVNDVIVDCSMLTSIQNIGTTFSSGSCQPITVQMKLDWTWSMLARNSVHFNASHIQALVSWGTPTPTFRTYIMSENPINSGRFEVITSPFTYAVENVCTFTVNAWPEMVKKTGDLVQPTFGCAGGANRQTYVLPAYRLDNQLLGGLFKINPAKDASNTLFCVGSNVAGFIFSDATAFNCNVSVEPARPNQGMRWTQFVYGTNLIGGNRIPNVFINVHGTPVQITDNDGNPMPNSWNVNPLDGSIVAPYSTSSGFFEGPVVEIPEPATGPTAQTFPINHIGSYTNDQVDDKFEVTLRNWGPCNKYTDFESPIETQSQIRLVLSPPVPTAPDKTICYNGSSVLSATRNGTNPGLLHWYNNADLAPSHEVGTGNTYDPGSVPAGVYHYWVREIGTAGNLCEGPAEEVKLTVNNELLQPGVISGPANICTNASGLVYSVVADPPVMPTGGATTYLWTVPAGWSITAGQGTKQITVTASAATGAQTVSVQTQYSVAPQCPSIARNFTTTVSLQPSAPALTKSPNVATVCSGQTLTVTATAGSGGTGTVQDEYRHSTDGGTSWSAWSSTIPSFAAVIGTNLIESRRTATGPGCNTSTSNQVSWTVVAQPTPPALTKSPNVANVCAGQTLTVTVVAGTGGSGTVQDQYRYSTNNGTSWSAWSTTIPSFTSVTGTNLVEGRRTATGTGCNTSASSSVSWNVVAQPIAPGLTKNPNVATVCTGQTLTVTITAGSGGTGAIADQYRFSIDNGASWSAWSTTIPSFAAVLGTNLIESRRTATGTGCTTSPSNQVSWTVVAQPTAPSLTKSPNVANVCAGQVLTVTITAGTGGAGTVQDEYRYSTDNGATWNAWSTTIPSFAAVTGTNIIEGRRTATGPGCTTSASNSVSWNVVAQPTPPALTKSPNVANVCAGQVLTVTVVAGTGGTGTVQDEYRYSTNNGGAWSAWSTTIPSFAAVTGTNLIESRRTATGTGCTTSPSNQISWTVVAQPVAPGLTKSPNIASVCSGQTLTVTVTAGTGGTGTVQDEYRYSNDNGGTWSAWSTTVPSFAAVIGTNIIESRRTATGTGCSTSPSNSVSWSVVAQPTAPSLNVKTPATASVCMGTNVSATFNAGSGGLGCTDEFQYRTHDGTAWSVYSPYVPGNNISTTGKTQVEIQGRRGNCTASTGCSTTAWITLATWTMDPLPNPVVTGSTGPCRDVLHLNPVYTYSTPSAGANTYLWTVTNGTISGPAAGNSVNIYWDMATGAGNVRVVETMAGTGCQKIIDYPVAVNPGPPVATPTASGPSAACVSASNITLSSTAVGTASEYEWDTPTGLFTSPGLTYNYNIGGLAVGSYNFRVRGTNGCGFGPWSAVITVNVVAQPVAPAITKSPNVATVCAGQTLTVTVVAGSGGAGTVQDEYRYSTNNGGAWSAWSTSVPSFAAVTGTNLVESRRTATGTGCTTSLSNQVSWTVVAQPVAPAMTKSPNVATVCAGQTLTVTVVAGSGGAGTVQDEYRYSTNNGGTWSAWSTSVPSFAAVAGTNLIESRRTATGTGCTTSPSNQVSWTVVAQPVAPAITKSPNVATICAGQTLTVTVVAGSGGAGTVQDEYRYSTDNGGTWSAWSTSVPSFAAVTGTNLIESRRTATGTGCTTSPSNQVSWAVVAQPVAPAITKSPNVATVCAGQILTVTVVAGSGGAGTVQDEYRYSTNNGGLWSAWSTSVPSFAAVTGTNLIESRRTATGTGCTTSPSNQVSWTVVAQPVAPAITKSPNVATVCAGQTLTVTVVAGSGGAGTVQDEYRYSTNNGGLWSAWSTTVPSFAAVTGTNLIESRRTATGTGCTTSPSNQVSWTVVAQPVAPAITKSPNVGTVCAGQTLTVTVVAGSGGAGTVQDEYRYSTNNGGTWSAWSTSVPSFAAVAGTNLIESRRTATGTGCTTSPSNQVSWTVVAQPVAPAITKSPNVGTVCAGQTLTVTVVAGSGGAGTVQDEYRYSTDNGGTWSAWSTSVPSFAAVTGTNLIESRRTATGTGCTTSPSNQVSWTVVAQPVAPAITKSPNVATVCAGQTLTVTVVAGSGGAGTVQDEYRYSTNNGGTWSAWSTSVPSFAAVTGTNLIESRRTATGTGCTTSPSNQVSWTVVAQPVAPAITKSPNVATVCAGQTLTVTVVAGSGGAGTVQDEYRYSTDNGGTWSAWSTTIPSFAAVTGTNLIESRRTATGTGCTTSPSNQVSWTVVAQPVAPGLTKSPNAASVCVGQTLTVTITPGSGGTGTVQDEYRFSTDNGATWSAWSTAIPSFAAVIGTNTIEGRRTATGGSCTVSPSNSVSWIVVAQPVAQSITKLPDLADACLNYNVSATFTGGSGGVAPVDVYQRSIDAGGTWAAYVPGNNISSVIAGAGRIQVRTMRQSTGFGCVNTPWTTVNWNVIPLPGSNAGGNASICASGTYAIAGSSATNHSTVIWSTAGDGSFNDATLLHPIYTPGTNDKTSGSVVLTLKSFGTGPCTAEFATSTMTLTINPLPATSAISGDPELCNNDVNKIYQVTNHGAAYSYAWTIPAAIVDPVFVGGLNFIIVNAKSGSSGMGTISVTETHIATGCSTTKTFDVTVAPMMPGENITGPASVCVGDAGVVYSVTTPRLTSDYVWTLPAGASITSADPSAPSVTVTFGTPALPGFISVVETSAEGCLVIHNTKTINVHPLPAVYNVTAPPTYCAGEPGVTLTLSDSESGVNYQLYDGAAPSGAVKAGTGDPLTWNVTAGSYTVRATNVTTSCAKEMNGTAVVTANPAIVIDPPVKTDVMCKGGADGTITLTAAGGTPSYLYSAQKGATPVFVSSNIFTGLTAGTYNIVVKDTRGCQATTTVTITEPLALAITSVVETNSVSCSGGSDGEAEVTVNALTGTGPYTYQWFYNAAMSSPVPGATGSTLSGVQAGTYYVLVSDAHLCTTTGSVTITQPSELVLSTSQVNVSCNGGATGSATVTPAGGTGPYNYSWNTAPVQTTAMASGLSAGSYTVTVTDAKGCVKTASVTITEPAVLTVTTSQVNVLCKGNTTGTATAAPSGGTAPYFYSWSTSPAQTTATATGLGAGVYTVIVTDSKGCTQPATVTITEPAAVLSATITSVNVACFGGSTGSATAVPAGGTGPYTYSWNTTPAQTTASVTDLAAGSYTVTIKDASLCETTATVNITQPAAALAVTTTQVNVLCNGASTGSATANVTGGTAPYDYSWNTVPVQTTATASGLAAGSYTVTVTDSKGCTKTASVTISQPTALVVTTTQVNVLCNGGTGSAAAAASGGVGPYLYSWSTVPVQATATATGLTAGTYTVTVTDANLCSTPATVTITQPAALTATTTQTDVLCKGNSSGSAMVIPAGGKAPYTYSWNTVPAQTTATAINLAAGTYTVTVKDANLCTLPVSVTITEPAAALTLAMSNTDVDCFGNSTGTATAAPAGGTAPYSYSWNTVPVQTTATATNLPAGTYTVTVTDDHGCVKSANVTVTQPAALGVTTTQVNVSCNGGSTGSATANVTGGTGPYNYSWSTSPAQITATATGLAAGTYDVTVTDSKGCIKTASVTITEPPVLTVATSQVNVLCTGSATGTATAIPAGGTAPYLYSWSATPAQTTAMASGLVAGVYTVTVTDGKACTETATVTITEPAAALSLVMSSTDVLCFGGSTGTATVAASGGTGAYTYSWFSNAAMTVPIGQFTAAAINLPAATYWVKVTDANLCAASASVTVGQPAAALAVTTTQVNVLCNGASTGSATANVTGGTAPYDYSWNTVPAQTTATASGLAAGTYTVTVTDSKGCTKTASVTISQPTALAVTTTQVNVLCNGGTGSATAVASGGVGPYLYSWSTVPVQATATATGLTAGTYTVTVTDANLCSTPATVTITEPAALAATTTQSDVLCKGNTSGSAMVIPSGGKAPYTYSWNTVPVQTTATAINLAAGTYTVTVKDANLCTLPVNVTITEPAAALTLAMSNTDVDCFGNSTGTAKATPAGGTAPYSYSWNTVPVQTTATATNLPAGTYTVTVTDDHGCVKSANVTVTQPAALNVTTTQVNVSCFGGSNGSATAVVTGGTTAYSYLWNTVPAQTTATATGLAAGTYEVTVTDSKGCIKTATVTITEPTALTVLTTQVNVLCTGNTTGSATAIPGGGTAPYSYSWSTTPAQTTAMATGLGAGTYTVTVTDGKGCIKPATVMVTEPAAALTLTMSKTDVLCFGGSTGSATVAATGGTGAYTYSWFSNAAMTVPIGQFTAAAINLPAATYWVKVTDANLCVASASVTVGQPVAALSVTTTQVNVLCNGASTGSATAVVSGGTGPYDYLWNTSPAQTTATASGLAAGSYIVTVIDAKGCSKMTNVTITQPLAISIIKDSQSNVLCYGQATGAINVTASGGTGAYAYAWTGADYTGAAFSSSSADLAGIRAGTYSLTVTDASACTGTLSSVTITQPTELSVALISSVDVQCNGDATGAIFINVTGGVRPVTGYAYAWTGPAGYTATAANISGLRAGTYDLTVTDQNSCSKTLTVSIAEPAALTPGSVTGADVLCYGENPGAITESAAPTGGPAAYEYQWQSSNASAGPWLSIPGAQMKDYTPPASPATTMYYRRAVTSGTCPAIYSNVIEIKVNPLPIARLTGGAVICSGESAILKVELTAGTGPYEVTINGTIVKTGYVSNSDIVVTPVATTTYRITKVKDSNGCEVTDPHMNISGTALVKVRALPAITANPAVRTICEYGATTFTAAASGDDVTWKWQADKGSGFEDLPEGGVHFGTTTPVLNIFGGTRTLNGYIYRAVATGCATSVNTTGAMLTVNTSPEIETQPVEKVVCSGENATFSVTARGTGLTYQWQVNTGGGFGNITDGGVYSGTSTPTLTLTNVPGSFNNFIYRVIVSGTCPSPAYSNFVPLRVNVPPAVSLHPAAKSICAETGTIFMTANGTGMIDEMRWQVNNSGTWTDLADDAVYNGTNTTQLSFINPPASLNGKQYRLKLKAACNEVFTNAATLTVYGNPVVSFGTDPVPNCGGTELPMNPLITGGSGTWSAHTWTGDVGPLSRYDVKSPVFKTLITGSYNLTYRVKDSNGCFGTAPVRVNVDSPDATFTHDVPNGCTPLTVRFTKADMTGITSWSWNFGDSSPLNTTDVNPTHMYINSEATSIQYRTVTLKVRTAGGCEATKTSTVTVYPKINANFTADKNTVCNGESITFTALSGANTYAWDFGDGVTANGSNVATHTYTNTGADPLPRTIRVTTTSFYGCTATATINVTILPKPVPAFSSAPMRQVYNTAGNTVTFTNETNAGAFNWAWSFGDGSNSAERNPSHTYTKIGEFNVTLEARNGTCSDKISHKVYVDPLPPSASFDKIPDGCEPLELKISNTSQNVNMPGTTYAWDFGDGGTSVAKNPTYTYYDPGVYRITLTVTGPGGTSTVSQPVHVYASPQAMFEVTPTKVFVNDEKVRGVNLSVGADYYVWEWGDGDTSKIKDPYHKYMQSGVYDVSLSAYKDNGNGHVCYDKYILSPGVTVEPAGEIRFATVFRPNLGGELSPTPPIPADKMDMFFYPPIQEKVLEYKLQVFNRQGVLIFESRDLNIPWNGYYKGKLCQQGVYVWFVEGKYSNGSVYKKVGDITLLH